MIAHPVRPRAALLAAAVLLCTAWTAQPARWRVTQDLRIGAVEGRNALTEFRSLVADAHGNVYVGQPQERTVKMFDRTGRLVRTFGRAGQGPGEFGAPSRLGWRGDTLWVSDIALLRVSMFSTATGAFLASHRLPRWSSGATSTPIRSVLPLADGSLLARPEASVAKIANGEITSQPLLRVVPPSMRLDTLAWMSTRNEAMFADFGPGRVMLGPQLVTDVPLWGASPSGRSVVMVDRVAAQRAARAEFIVTRLRPDGGVVYRRHYRYEPQPFPRGYDDQLVARFLEGRERMLPNRAAAEREIRRKMYLPPFRPPITELVVGGDETVWLRREEPAGAEATWNVLDPAGEIIATVRIPAAARVLAADRRSLWAVVRNDVDVPFVVRYRVQPG